MINASNEFLVAIKENTAFWVTANVVLNNGESLTLQKSDLYVSGNRTVPISHLAWQWKRPALYRL